MNLEQTIILFVIAALVGGAGSYLAFALPARRKASIAERRSAELAVKNAALGVSADRVPPLEQENVKLREQLQHANKESVELKTKLEAELKNHEAHVEDLRKMDDELERKFTVLASDALGKNSDNFLKLVSERFGKHRETADEELEKRKKEIETLVKPIGESLSKFEHRVGEIEKAREGAYGAITEQVKSLAEGQTNLRSETGRLVQALRQPKTRGRWGEYQLRNVLEMAGMTEHVDFVEEKTIEGEDGRLRPDVIVRLPGGKSVIVDAKTSLEAYLSAVETDDEDTREQLMADHARQVRDRVRTLASRDYWNALPETPDFVVMFIPGEAFFAAAIERDPGLFETAVRQRVLICTPTTFVALVKAIAYGWQQEKLAESALEIAERGRDLYDRIKVFGGHMGDLGRSLRQAVDRYNQGIGSLEGRLLPAARRFETLGVVPAGSSIPALEPVELEAREVQAEELTISQSDEEKTID